MHIAQVCKPSRLIHLLKDTAMIFTLVKPQVNTCSENIYCEPQRLPVQKLSSTIFPLLFVRPSRLGDISTYLHYMMFWTIQT